MINAGRVLIIPKGEWTNLESYEMLDLVTRGDIAYIARQASVGVDPATDTQLIYWQPFGTAAKIATTTTPGLVMPDGTTITIDATGLISANIGISDIKNVTITSISNGQILQYNSSTQKWENKSLGTAASRNATSSITSGSTDLIESGAVNALKQTLEQSIAGKLGTSDIANNLTTTTAGKVLDATQGKALNDSKADKTDLASISITGTTNNTGSTITQGTFFYKSGTLVRAKTDIANGATLTQNTNYEEVTAGALNASINNTPTPDFANAQTLTVTTTNQTFQSDGFFIFNGFYTSGHSGAAPFFNFYIDDKLVGTGNVIYDAQRVVYPSVPVKKGMTYKYTLSSGTVGGHTGTFIPYKS